MKKIMSLILTCTMLCCSICVHAADDGEVLLTIAKNVYASVSDPTVAAVGGEWAILGLARSGADIPVSYYEKYYDNVKNYVASRGGVLHDKKYTEYSRVIIALSSIGKNPENVEGYNLTAPLNDIEKTSEQGINGPVWALIALSCRDGSEHSNTDEENVKAKYIDKILSSQNADGSWSLADNGKPDADITAMALCALAKYRGRSDVSAAADRALEFLSNAQNADGGFASWDGENSESCAQVITALCELGISINDKRFVKNGNTVADAFMTYYNGKGGFGHTAEDGGVSQMSTEQGLYALAALKRANQGETTLFDMSDVTMQKDNTDKNSSGLENKIPEITKREKNGAKTFSDISKHSSKDEIEELASRGIINGKSEDLFEPDATMTRAEFAAIVVQSLGLSEQSTHIFEDVGQNDWFFGFVAAAYKYNIISGVSDTEFNPNGTITREEAAVMISRAAKLCGMDTEYTASQSRDILSAFADYISASGWAANSLAFCFDSGIMPDDEMEIKPQSAALRAEIAVMLYNLLDRAKLL